MTIVPQRDLGSVGIVTDVDPFDLPLKAWSFGSNVRFENGHIERGSVFRTAGQTLSDPKNALGYIDGVGAYHIILAAPNGTLSDWGVNSETSCTPTGWTPTNSDVQVTFTTTNNLVVANRPDHVPWYRSKDSVGLFQQLPTGATQWGSDWRAKALRSVAGVLVALNITKGAASLPNNVLWSDFVQYNTPPNWDTGGTTSSAGENTLAEMKDPIVDGLRLRDRLMIYSGTETWNMEYIGGNDMFSFQLQFDRGIIGTNCVVEAGGLHYVFGQNDIWLHDGIQDKSIATGSVRRFIYEGLRASEKEQFFTGYNQDQNEIVFCYVSDDAFAKFPPISGKGCNRAAIYNISAGTWYFADVPYVTCWTRSVITASKTFDQTSQSYTQIGGSFASAAGETKPIFLLGVVNEPTAGITRGLRSYSYADSANTSFPLDTNGTKGAFLYREGIDLDELNVELRGYKMASSIYPQIRLAPDAEPLVFTLGSSDYPSEEPVWGNPQTYDVRLYKLDHNIAGRYLSMKMEQTDTKPFKFSGIDYDLTILGTR